MQFRCVSSFYYNQAYWIYKYLNSRSISNKFDCNIHSNNLNDNRYINVSVEQINYTPVLLEDILVNRRKELLNI